MARLFALIAFCNFAILLVPSTLLAAGANPDRFQINHDIRIEADDRVADVTCINCSVYVRGQVSGDVTTINGNVVAEQGAAVAGDITAIRGNARVENGTQVAGDLTAIAGTAWTVRSRPSARARKSRATALFPQRNGRRDNGKSSRRITRALPS